MSSEQKGILGKRLKNYGTSGLHRSTVPSSSFASSSYSSSENPLDTIKSADNAKKLFGIQQITQCARRVVKGEADIKALVHYLNMPSEYLDILDDSNVNKLIDSFTNCLTSLRNRDSCLKRGGQPRAFLFLMALITTDFFEKLTDDRFNQFVNNLLLTNVDLGIKANYCSNSSDSVMSVESSDTAKFLDTVFRCVFTLLTNYSVSFDVSKGMPSAEDVVKMKDAARARATLLVSKFAASETFSKLSGDEKNYFAKKLSVFEDLEKIIRAIAGVEENKEFSISGILPYFGFS